MTRKKILVLAEYIGENHNSTAYYWSQIVKSLQKEYDVIVVTPDTKYSREFYKSYGISTKFVKFSKHNKNSLYSRLFGQIKQTNNLMRVVRKEIYNVDLVFSGTNPIIAMFTMALYRYIRKFNWLVLVHDVFPNNLIPGNVLHHSSFIYRILNYISNKVYSKPDHLLSIGRDMKQLLENKVGSSDKVSFVPNWASTDKVKLEEKIDNKIISELGWGNNIVFQFFGNMGRLQDISSLLDAIVLTKNINARFLFIGCGSEAKKVEEVARLVNENVGYKRIIFYGNLELSKNNIGLNACDIALVTLSPNMFGLGVPSKAYFSMAANKPILYVGDKGSELELLLSEYDVGWYCRNGDKKVLADLLDKITANYIDSSSEVKIKPRRVLANNFSEEIALSSISKIVQGML